MQNLLIIDDEPEVAVAVRPGFRNMDVQVHSATTAAEGLKAVTEHAPDMILLDIGLPDLSGLELCSQIRRIDARIPIIVMTGQGTTETAIEAMKRGAFEYVQKPFTFSRVKDLATRALAVGHLMRDPVRLSHQPSSDDATSEVLIGRCEAMQEVFKMIGRVATQEGTVLIRGESGTGKELVARAIYQHSRRSEGPFLAINCAAIPEALLESELFGHEKGAFTGAERRRIGKFEQCSGGTLLLDEIGDMTSLTQAKILRVLQEQRFERVGGDETLQTDVRIIAATNRNLEKMVAEGRFREDLYYRLNVFEIWLPPLRNRVDDLPVLVGHFVRRFSRQMERDLDMVAPETLDMIARYHWPGNLREFQSVLKQALLRSAGPVLLPAFLPDYMQARLREAAAEPEQASPLEPWEAFLEERLRAGSQSLYAEWFSRMERHLLMRVLRHTGGNQVQAAAILGVTRRTLRNKIRGHGIAIERSITDEDEEEVDDE